MYSIKHYLIIKSSANIIFNALVKQEGLSAWWTEDTVTDSKIGNIIEFHFGDLYHNKMKIKNLEEEKLVEWECIHGDKEWIGTKFSFELEQRENDTILRFVHSNWKEETDFFANCNYHWGYYLRSLKLYCETGEGTPFRIEQN